MSSVSCPQENTCCSCSRAYREQATVIAERAEQYMCTWKQQLAFFAISFLYTSLLYELCINSGCHRSEYFATKLYTNVTIPFI